MKLTKKLETEIFRVYNTYWDGVLKGDIVSMMSCVNNDFQIIGSAEGEVFLNKKDAMQFYNATADQVAGKIELRNREIKTTPIDELILLSEISDIYALIEDEWIFYSKFRSTALLKKMKNGWKFVQLHASIPDSKTEVGEQIAFEKIQKENLELRDAVKRRTAELEYKNRELEIESSLERIRSRALGMHQSSEVKEVSNLLFSELEKMNINLAGFNIIVFDKKRDNFEMWRAKQVAVPNEFESFSHKKMYDKLNHYLPGFVAEFESEWKRGKPYYLSHFTGEKRISFLKANSEIYNYSDEQLEKMKELYNDPIIWYMVFFKQGWLGLICNKNLSENELLVSHRFAEVFEFAYTRFLDIQKAEAQAREAQIEAALERVRSRSIAMRISEEIADIAAKIFSELRQLDLALNRVLIWTFNDAEKYTTWWSANPEVESTAESYRIDYNENPVFINYLQAWQQRKPIHLFTLSGDTKKTWEDHLFEHTEMSSLPMEVRKGMRAEGTLYTVSVISDYGLMMSGSFEPLPEASIDIIQRFGRVFQQSYTRYLDVQKAEAQARESEIQLALERVRARTMAMHKSDGLKDVVRALYKEFRILVTDFVSVNILLKLDSSKDIHFWSSVEEDIYPELYHLPYSDLPIFEKFHKAFNSPGDGFIDYLLNKEEKDAFFSEVFKIQPIPPKRKKMIQNAEGMVIMGWFHKHSGIEILRYNLKRFDEEEKEIVKRFAAAFEQTYIRFLDLQKAEAQAREAQIEAALEKVRGKAMAMHNSNDLSDTASVVFTELRKLGVNPIRTGVGLFSKESRKVQLYSAIPSATGDSLSLVGWVQLEKHHVLEKIYETWLKQEDYFPEMQGEEMRSYYKSLLAGLSVPMPEFKNDEKQFGHFITSSIGDLYAWSEEPFNEDQIKIFRRFASIIDLTFRRYLELQKSEANAKEAVKRAALDRVRAEIASMRNSEDLSRITPVVWRELQVLEVPFIRCGVFIVNEEETKTHVYLSTPDGKALGALNLSFDANELTANIVEHWKKKQVYKEHWNKEEFINWTKSMMELGQVQNAETYQGSSTPPESLNLHFVPFTQGMLYVGDVSPLTDEKLDLVKILAEAFSIAYARYEDFKNLEEAKNKIEITLNELKNTQAQLVHSEKMASLGELTAGIAHEIKNPLNFVNNFSEISGELLDEIKEELEKNDKEEILAILEDLKQNLEKINQHGKRADSIVKGMLLHSRGSSGEKALTDINDLLDQYVNLAYHGMRAQNKEFNITIEKDFDETLEKMNVVPQDISRVFLNIINNACYAAYEKKKKSSDNNFSPTLKVSTKSLVEKIEIRIGDNGNGIPNEISDKIFQPFFTTKPTGEGTGLGLSLSYDIVVKQHGGEIKIESKEGEGAEFVITLPN